MRSLIRNLTRQDVNNHAPICQLKEEYKFITDPLDIAECLTFGLKTAKITPIYKGKASKDDKNNYRPISVHLHYKI